MNEDSTEEIRLGKNALKVGLMQPGVVKSLCCQGEKGKNVIFDSVPTYKPRSRTG